MAKPLGPESGTIEPLAAKLESAWAAESASPTCRLAPALAML